MANPIRWPKPVMIKQHPPCATFAPKNAHSGGFFYTFIGNTKVFIRDTDPRIVCRVITGGALPHVAHRIGWSDGTFSELLPFEKRKAG